MITYQPMLQKKTCAGICVFSNSYRINRLGFELDKN